jgi:peptide/nickel transport system permease protein
MSAYIIRRFSLVIPTMVVVTMVVFLSVRFVPGDVIDMMIAQMGSSGSMTPINRQYLEKAMGLDVPMPIQYVRWLGVAPQDDGQFKGLIQAARVNRCGSSRMSATCCFSACRSRWSWHLSPW